MKKIVTLTRLECGTNGAVFNIPLPPSPGGRSCKVVQYMAKVTSFGGTPTLGMVIAHGPDGAVSAPQITINPAGVPASHLYVFDSDATKILGEWLHPVLTVGGAATGDYLVVELFELRKPF